VVLRRPVLVALPILAVLLVLAAPILGVRFGDNDERILPAGNPARQAIETLKADFPALSSAGIQVVLRGTQGDAPAAPAGTTFAAEVEKIPGIAAVAPAGSGGDVLLYTATLTGTDPFSTAARDAVAALRALPAPAGTEVLVGGTTAGNVDSLAATAEQLPLMVSLLVGATLVLMFLAFGSILLPVKAVLLSALSLCATFGVLVWIFQDGHGAGLLQVTPAPPEAGIVVLMAAVVFGLSTDYEVFLLSRMVEARTRGASTAEAVTTGLARTGRVISAAAILLIVVTGAFALSSVTTMRFIGVGMIVALVLDATVVRMLLVPAVLKLMGDAAWWAPGPLRRLQERAGLAEYEDEELFPTVSVGRHAAPEPGAARPTVAPAGAAPPRHASWFEAPGGAASVSPASPVSPAGGGPGHFSAGVPVSGGATSGYPVAGSAPLPAPSRITLDQPEAVGDSDFRAGEGPGERTDALPAPPAWPPSPGQASGSRTSDAAPVSGSQTSGAAPDASGIVPASGRASAPGGIADPAGSPGAARSIGQPSGGPAVDDQPITVDLAARVSPAPDPVSPAVRPVSPASGPVSPVPRPVSPAPDPVSHPVSAPGTSQPRTTDTSRTGKTDTSRPATTGSDPDPAPRPGEHDGTPEDNADQDDTAILELPPGHPRPPT
jgi:RND superfamily putative drug exporter